jgi:hypothetical protein
MGAAPSPSRDSCGSTLASTGNTVTNLNNANISAFPLAFAGAQAGGRTMRVAVGIRF